MDLTAAHIAEWCRGRLEGPDLVFAGLETQELAGPGHVTFAGQASYSRKIATSQASGAIVSEGLPVQRRPEQTIIWVENADLAVAEVLERIAPPLPVPPVGVHPTAVIDPGARLGAQVRIGPHVVVQEGAVIGDRCALMAGVFIGAGSEVGEDCLFWPHVTLRERCRVGKRVICHPGCVIGADGFGYRFADNRHVKMPHIGTVEIGDDCEFGANTTIDRGKFSATVIGAGSKLDNLVQIGHNVRLGKHSIMVAFTALGGSVQTGDYLMVGGGAMVADHVKVGTAVQIAGFCAVTSDAADGQRLGGIPARPIRDFFNQLRAVNQLPKLVLTVRDLEQRTTQLESSAKNDRS